MSLFTRSTPDTSAQGVHDGTGAGDDEGTVRAARKRFARRQWARRWLAWRRLLVGALLVGLVVGCGWLVFLSSVLAVDGVQVTGTVVESPAAVRRAAQVPVGAPLATVDLDAVSARVGELVAVDHVDVSRAWPDRVRIDVSERTAVAVVEPTEQGGRLRGTDAEGTVFRTFATRPRGLPVIRTGDKTGADALAEAAAVAGSLPPDLAAKVAYVEVSTVDTITLELRSGRSVRWGSADGSAAKAQVLAVLLRQKASYYDVSVPGQPVIRR
jgi:cell division protein FtsQ